MKTIFTSLLLLPFTLFAATFTVTTTSDAGPGSLRQAIIDANATAGAPHTINIVAIGTIVLTADLPPLSVSTFIYGAPAGSIISGNNTSRIFQFVGSGSNMINVQLKRLTLQHAFANVIGTGFSGGAAVSGNNLGSILIEDCFFRNDTVKVISTDNVAEVRGGAVFISGPSSIPNSSTAIIRRCTFAGNAVLLAANQSATADGGALYSITLTDTIENCTFYHNGAGAYGALPGGAVRASGGAIAFYGSSARVINCTVTANGSLGQQIGGGTVDTLGNAIRLLKYQTEFHIGNCILDSNLGSPTPNIYPGGFVSDGNNIISNIGSIPASNFAASDLLNTGAMTASLSFNGGLSPTCALLPGSPAVDKVTTFIAPTTDERGFFRNGPPDAGAYEYNGIGIPLTLLGFTATVEEGTVRLNWQTASEINVSRFDIERSTNGLTFTRIGLKEAANSSRKSYVFLDGTPINGRNYYRLKMIDKDGKYSYSPIAIAIIKINTGLVITPNPMVDKISFANSEATEARIYGADGRVLLTKRITQGTSDISVSSLGKGTYTLRLFNNGLPLSSAGFIKL